MITKRKGWPKEYERHALASRGIKTKKDKHKLASPNLRGLQYND